MSPEPQTASEPQAVADAPVLRTPAEWSALTGVTVMDPDGWRGTRILPAKSWEEPIGRDEWEQRLAVSTQSLSTTQPEAESLSVIDRVGLRLMCVKVYGVTTDPYIGLAREQWGTTPEWNRKAWRRSARALLAEAGWMPDGFAESIDNTSSTEYELRDAHDAVLDDWYGDISEIVAAYERNPGSEMFERQVLTTVVRGEWTEVPR
jgi:hypothetical protein